MGSKTYYLIPYIGETWELKREYEDNLNLVGIGIIEAFFIKEKIKDDKKHRKNKIIGFVFSNEPTHIIYGLVVTLNDNNTKIKQPHSPQVHNSLMFNGHKIYLILSEGLLVRISKKIEKPKNHLFAIHLEEYNVCKYIDKLQTQKFRLNKEKFPEIITRFQYLTTRLFKEDGESLFNEHIFKKLSLIYNTYLPISYIEVES